MLVGSVTGQTELTLPSNYSELLVVCYSPTDNINFTINIPKAILTTSYQYFMDGFDDDSGATYGAVWTYCKTTKYKLEKYLINGTLNRTASTISKVFYKI